MAQIDGNAENPSSLPLLTQSNTTVVPHVVPHIPTHIDTLLDVIQKLSLAKDLETIMFIVRKAARQLTGADGATFVLREEGRCYYADEDAIAPLWKGKRFPMSICISGWSMENHAAVVIPDIYADPRIPADAYRVTFVKSMAMVPIRTASPIGAIGTYWADYYNPTDEQIQLLKALADSTSVAMENILLHTKLTEGSEATSAQMEITRKLMESNRYLEISLRELNRRNQEMQWLKELSSTLQTCLHIEEAYKLTAQYINKLLPDVAGALYTMHASRNYLESMTTWGTPGGIKDKMIKPEECLALRKGAIYKVDHLQSDLLCAHYKTNNELSSYICIPLFAQSDIVGLLYLEWKNSGDDAETQQKIKNQAILVSMIAEQVAIGISNIKLRETLRNLSFHDALTGLYNRRYLQETLERELNRCARKSASLAVFMLDVDHFKDFNDKFGHEAGDIVLQNLANILRKFIRKYDIACRFGGEEFIFVLPEIELKAALQRAQSFHEEVSRLHLRYGGIALTQITISIGVAMFPIHGNTIHDLVAAADAALYQAKNSGRNKTVIYNPTDNL